MSRKLVVSLLDELNSKLCCTSPIGEKLTFQRCLCKNNKNCKSFCVEVLRDDGIQDMFLWIDDDFDFKFLTHKMREYINVPFVEFFKYAYEQVKSNNLVESKS